MKKTIIFCIIFFVVGAILSGLVFYYYNKYSSCQAVPVADTGTSSSANTTTNFSAAELDSKFQAKLAGGYFEILSHPVTTNGQVLNTTGYLSGVIKEVNPVGSFFTIDIKNEYSGGSLTDFLYKQPATFNIRISVNAQTKITEHLLPGAPDAQGKNTSGDSTPKNINIDGLKSGEVVDVTLDKFIDVASAASANAVSVQALRDPLQP